MTQILLVRHGQTEWNRIERFRGRIDVPLNAVGRRQAEQTGAWIAARWQVSAVYSSPLSRAVDTAQAIARHYDLVVIPNPGVIDLNLGDWQGKTPQQVQETWPEDFATWLNHPEDIRFPGGETLDELRARTREAIRVLGERHPDETIVVVAHTDVNRAILLNVLNWPTNRIWQLGQDNCAINIIYMEDGQAKIISMNITEHLKSNETKKQST